MLYVGKMYYSVYILFHYKIPYYIMYIRYTQIEEFTLYMYKVISRFLE